MSVNSVGFQVYKGQESEKIMDEKGNGSTDGSDLHMDNFLEEPQLQRHADIEGGVVSANLVHLGNTSYRLKRVLRYDDAGRSFINDAEANAYLTRKFRAPYVVPDQV